MPKGTYYPEETKDEIARAILAGEASQAVAKRLGVPLSTVLRHSSNAAAEQLRPGLLVYLLEAGKIDKPGDIPTKISHRYGIHRTVHLLQVFRKEGLISARQAPGSLSLRDIELTERGMAVASRFLVTKTNGHAHPGPLNERLGIELPPVPPLTEEETATVARLTELAVTGVDFTVPTYPILERLRARTAKRSERARLLEAAADLADDEDEGILLLEQAEKARAGANTPIEDEYLDFASRYMPEE